MGKAIIITIGDEILNGQTVDSNSAFIARALNGIGFDLVRILSIADKAMDITEAINESLTHCDLLITTGGLGPTIDDITKQTLSSYFDLPLVLHKPTLEYIQALFEGRGIELTKANRRVAMLPEGSEILQNTRGTAQAMLFEKNGCLLCAMPGVPHEMRGIVEEQLIPLLKKRFILPPIKHLVIRTAGVPESIIADKIKTEIEHLPKQVSIAFLPSAGQVKVRLSLKNAEVGQENVMEELGKGIEEKLGKWVYGRGKKELTDALGDRFLKTGGMLATAESCTGGMIAHTLVLRPGASSYFMGGLIAYDNGAKVQDLGVTSESLNAYGSVSEEVALEMLWGVIDRYKVSHGIAVTGIMGPGGAVPGKPVGMVWIASGSREKHLVKLYHLGDHRKRNMRLTTVYALNQLRLSME